MNRQRLGQRLIAVDVAKDHYRAAVADFFEHTDAKARAGSLERLHSARWAYVEALVFLADTVRNELSGGA